MPQLNLDSLNNITLAFTTLIAEKKTEELFQLYQHFVRQFPPIAYGYSNILLSCNFFSKYHALVGRNSFFVDPEMVFYYTERNQQLHKAIFGKRIPVYKESSDSTIILYSKKFSENYVSSQEALRPIINFIVKHFNTVLISPFTNPASDYYKSLAPYHEIEQSGDIELISKLFKSLNSRVIIDLSLEHNNWLNYINNSYLFSLYPFPRISGGRENDLIINDSSHQRYKVTNQKKLYLNDLQIDSIPVIPCRDHDKSKQLIDISASSKKSSNRLKFGAFCRLNKLNLQTLYVWAMALKEFKNSDLYFSTLFSTKQMQNYMRIVFNEYGIDKDRIKFFPPLTQDSYLQELSKMDVVFGSSPEQGGVSFSDSLLLGIPYIINETLSVTKVATNSLKSIGRDSWSVQSADEFIATIAIAINEYHKQDTTTRHLLQEEHILQQKKCNHRYQKHILQNLKTLID